MSSNNFARLLSSQMKRMMSNRELVVWAFPGLLGFSWIIWPALDYDWKMSMGLAPDPEYIVNKVEAERIQRMEALKKNKPASAVKGEDDDEEEEEEEEAPAAEEEEEEEEAPPAAEEEEEEDVPAAEDGDAEEEEEEDSEEEKSVNIKPLYDPTKGEKLSLEEIFDNFTIKAVKMTEDDDDDEDEDGDDDDDDDDDDE